MPAVEPVGLKCLRNQTQLLQCRRASLASMSVRQSARATDHGPYTPSYLTCRRVRDGRALASMRFPLHQRRG